MNLEDWTPQGLKRVRDLSPSFLDKIKEILIDAGIAMQNDPHGKTQDELWYNEERKAYERQLELERRAEAYRKAQEGKPIRGWNGEVYNDMDHYIMNNPNYYIKPTQRSK